MAIKWTDDQLVEIEKHYKRIGYRAGELWPSPPAHWDGERILQLLRGVPDRTGIAGYKAALAGAAAA
jgi:hypothetical protein